MSLARRDTQRRLKPDQFVLGSAWHKRAAFDVFGARRQAMRLGGAAAAFA